MSITIAIENTLVIKAGGTSTKSKWGQKEFTFDLSKVPNESLVRMLENGFKQYIQDGAAQASTVEDAHIGWQRRVDAITSGDFARKVGERSESTDVGVVAFQLAKAAVLNLDKARKVERSKEDVEALAKKLAETTKFKIDAEDEVRRRIERQKGLDDAIGDELDDEAREMLGLAPRGE